MLPQYKHIKDIDEEVYDALQKEHERQNYKINLIASENYTSKAVLEAQGCIMTNKYAEGYPGKRYYGGCENVDIAERLAIERCKRLFGAEHANVQPHSGSAANMAVYFTVLKPRDTILSMDVTHGGHLSHSSPVNFSGKLYNVVTYGVSRKDEMIDHDEVLGIARKAKPKLIVVGASAYPRIIDFKRFHEIADDVGAYLMADIAHIAGMVTAGVHPSPVPHADFVTTTTHKTLRGARGGIVMCREEFARDVDRAVFPGMQGGPLMHVIAAKAVCLKEALTPEFKAYQEQIVKNAKALADVLIENRLRLVSGGTDNHLMLVNLRELGITGKDAEAYLSECGIILNKNTIPFEELGPFVTSGIRIGTPSVTTRGMKENEMRLIGSLIARGVQNMGDANVRDKILSEIGALCEKFPVP